MFDLEIEEDKHIVEGCNNTPRDSKGNVDWIAIEVSTVFAVISNGGGIPIERVLNAFKALYLAGRKDEREATLLKVTSYLSHADDCEVNLNPTSIKQSDCTCGLQDVFK